MTVEGNRVRGSSINFTEKLAEFIANLESIGEIDFLAVNWPSSGASMTSDDRHGVTVTPVPGADDNFSEFDSPPSALGRNGGKQLHLNGTDERLTTPDIDRFSYGDGAVDSPFSVVVLMNPDQVAVRAVPVSKRDTTASQEEWHLAVDTNGYPEFVLEDDSASADIGREDQTSLSANTWVLIAATYDASAAVTGINIYRDGLVLDDADISSGTYAAMENGAELLTIGCDYAAGTASNFWSGAIGFVAIYQKELIAQDTERIVQFCNDYYAPEVAL